MNRRDLALALLVVTVWGSSFTVIRIGLDSMPPMLLAALRFSLAAIPAVFFIRRPAIQLNYLLAYGATVGIGQFGCMFYAMHLGLPAGLASVVLQSQAFFTLLLAALMLQEKVSGAQLGACNGSDWSDPDRVSHRAGWNAGNPFERDAAGDHWCCILGCFKYSGAQGR